jgi:predicted RNase H-like HicB family nuclease
VSGVQTVYTGSVQIEFTVQIWKEGDQFIAHAMPLDVASSGVTAESARQALDEAVRLFVATAAAHGTLPEVLEEAGYVLQHGQWQAPAWISVERGAAVVSG